MYIFGTLCFLPHIMVLRNNSNITKSSKRVTKPHEVLVKRYPCFLCRLCQIVYSFGWRRIFSPALLPRSKEWAHISLNYSGRTSYRILPRHFNSHNITVSGPCNKHPEFERDRNIPMAQNSFQQVVRRKENKEHQ